MAPHHRLPTLLEEAEECLAQSNLIFLLADLRLLSATGRIHTSFDTIAIDSDRVTRIDTGMLAQRMLAAGDNLPTPECHGMFPAQIMAVLLIELRKEVQAWKARRQTDDSNLEIGLTESDREFLGTGPSYRTSSSRESPQKSLEEQEQTAVQTSSNLFDLWTDPRGRKKYEVDMHSQLKAYSDMIGKDLCSTRPEISRSHFMERVRSLYLKRPNDSQQHNAETRAKWSNDPFFKKEKAFSSPLLNKTQPLNVITNNNLHETPSLSLDVPQPSFTPTNIFRGEDGRDEIPISTLKEELLDALNASFEKRQAEIVQEENCDASSGVSVMVDGEGEGEKQKSTTSTKKIKIQPLEIDTGHDRHNIYLKDISPARNHSWACISPTPIEGLCDSKDSVNKMDAIRECNSMGVNHSLPRSPLPATLEAYLNNAKESQRHVFQNVQEKVAGVTEKVGKQLDNAQYTERQRLENLVSDFFNVGVVATGQGGQLSSHFTRPLTEDELLDLMERAVESRRRERVRFMASFFREGTVSNLIAKSTSKVVWLNDWYPLKDPTYAISIDEEKKRVLVVFRGAITRADWGHSYDLGVARTQNPVKEEYEGKRQVLKFHRGFYQYLFRRRKDTNTSKYDEIATKVEQYAKVIGKDFKIVVTGHSLGAALGTLFSFYASCEERFTKNAPIKFISFGCPYVGGYAFGDAFRYQEQMRRIIYARFHNERDIVTHGPNLNLGWSSRGAQQVHVGISVKLPRTVWWEEFRCCVCCDKGPQIDYTKSEGSFLESYGRAVKNNFLWNMSWPWKFRQVHNLNEHQDRILHGRENNNWNPLLDLSLEELYETIVLNDPSNAQQFVPPQYKQMEKIV